jgi:hypothetical protein
MALENAIYGRVYRATPRDFISFLTDRNKNSDPKNTLQLVL